ncbi:malto-oligosyltrehalose synthase [Iamia majanohamensis]|uniref:Malto-oligosyltrehalose synthase n=1 Tax=Iamia majanohamensis TaxID=467976 RepID=A0AAE9YI23_9ACTN|nr:malto-oligosyltrehalose synthase [Iamia majanohamensis]WCO68201.1 malto-oligosyltrehalose synthase [Iamia majanohamensis]
MAEGPGGLPLLATYRVQLTPELDLVALRALVPYLRDLGISHLYLSPVLTARSGSTHGYDQVDPTTVSAALGGEEALRALAAEGMGLVLDIVPNHMGTGDENRWWSDPDLRERFFDLDPETGRWRRFFDVDDLAALRQEDGEVFATTHAKVRELLADGTVAGVRVDHPDGLADPAGYLARLDEAAPGDVWVEKILHTGEELRDWPVSGTVGYEFLNDVTALFVDPAGAEDLTALWHEVSGDPRPFVEVAAEAEREQAVTTFRPEVERLAREAAASGLDDLADVAALTDAVASLPVYRTYVVPERDEVAPADRAAVADAGIDGRLARVLLLEERGHDAFVTRFQQTTPAVTAKGVEDTAFYRYLRLLALNEVGGDPGRFGLDVDAFHAANAERARRHPRNLLETSTHDTKRSADVRARLATLAGRAGDWVEHVHRWMEVTAPLVTDQGPDDPERYLVFQTLLGAWPIDAERLEEYLRKALREAKRTTTWVDPDEQREEAVIGFATALRGHRPFLDTFLPLAAEVGAEGAEVGRAMVLLKLTCPGVPDVYQGDELEDLSLVDPDNRRPVDWDLRREALDGLRAGTPPTDDTAKLDLVRRVLALRAERPGAFAGAYRPVGAGAGTCAFTRGDDEVLVVVATRPDADGTVEVPPGPWRAVLADGPDVGGGEAVPVAHLLGGRRGALWVVGPPAPG